MKIIKLTFLIVHLIIISETFAQVKPTLNIYSGIAIPAGEMRGDLVSADNSEYIFINSDFIKNNYAASEGVTISGTLKIPFDKRGLISGLFLGSYSYFNAFTRSKIGTTIENGLLVPVTFDSRLSATTFGLGIEINPLTSGKIVPYINSEFTFNILSLSLKQNDIESAIFNDAFRMGIMTGAGISFRLNDEYKLLFGGTYHLSNMFLKSSGGSYEERVSFGRENIPINDGQGIFYSNISNPDSEPSSVSGIKKNAAWWNVNIGLSIELGKSKK